MLAALTLPLAIGIVTIALASSTTALYVGRVFAGFGGGAAMARVLREPRARERCSRCAFRSRPTQAVAPVYATEVAPSSLRGALGGSSQLFVYSGISYTLFFGMFLDWRLLSASPLPVLLIGATAALCSLPESPRWLAGKCRPLEDTAAALRSLRPAGADVAPEARALTDSGAAAALEPPASPADACKPPVVKPLMVILVRRDPGSRSCHHSSHPHRFFSSFQTHAPLFSPHPQVLMILQQASGINAVFFNLGPIFRSVGIDAADLSAFLVTFPQARISERTNIHHICELIYYPFPPDFRVPGLLPPPRQSRPPPAAPRLRGRDGRGGGGAGGVVRAATGWRGQRARTVRRTVLHHRLLNRLRPDPVARKCVAFARRLYRIIVLMLPSFSLPFPKIFPYFPLIFRSLPPQWASCCPPAAAAWRRHG